MPKKDGLVMDHINRNKLDNSRENLRHCTQQQNSWNNTRKKTNKSGCSGIYWDKTKMKWQAAITVNYKKKFLGYYKNKDDAINARLEAEKLYFGDHAKNNQAIIERGV